jgi:hypothetical protein
VTNERPAQPGRERLDKLLEAETVRSYRPVMGPDEPAVPPPGKASIWGTATSAAETGDQNTTADAGRDGPSYLEETAVGRRRAQASAQRPRNVSPR